MKELKLSTMYLPDIELIVPAVTKYFLQHRVALNEDNVNLALREMRFTALVPWFVRYVNTVEPVENGFHTDTNFFEWLAGTLMGNQNFVAVIADDIKRMTAPAILPRQKFATVGALYDYLHEELSVSICPSLTRKSLIELHVPDRDRGGEHDWSMITFRSGYAADFGLCEDCTSDTGSALGLQALCADPYGEE